MSFNFTQFHRLLIGLVQTIDTKLWNLLDLAAKSFKDHDDRLIVLEDKIAWRVTSSVPIPCTSGAYTLIYYDTTQYDSAFLHTAFAEPGKVTIKESGYYHFGANIELSSNTLGLRLLVILVNDIHVAAAEIPGTSQISVSIDKYLNKLDYITVKLYQNSGSTLNISANGFSPMLWGHKL